MNVLTWLEQKFSEWFGYLGTFLKPMALAIAQAGGEVLVQAATAAVAAVEADPSILGSAAKRQAAFEQILAELEAKGIPIVAHAINGAIEAAVAALSAQKAGA